MNRVCVLICGAAVFCMNGAAAESEPAQVWRVVAMRSAATADAAVPLPPLAAVTSTDTGGQTWQQSGEIGGSLEAALKEFAVALGAAGWGLDKTIMLGRLSSRSGLTVWNRGRQRVLLMLWEKEAGTCGFAWGRE
ncbi:MAG: hypothetical protein PHU80_02290 [Kiritimatiellae bacterium]|nr:hypothetical protein [Kiritimatiellia bacterium]